MSTRTTKRLSPKIKTSHPSSSTSSRNANSPKPSFPPSKTNATSISSVSSPLSSATKINSNGILKPSIPKPPPNNKKSNKCTKSIAKECRSSKRSRLPGSIEKSSLPITFPRLRAIFPPIRTSLPMRIIHVHNLMRGKILREEGTILRIHWRRIFLVRCCWRGRRSTAVWKRMHLAVLRWDKVRYCRVKTFLTSEYFLN